MCNSSQISLICFSLTSDNHSLPPWTPAPYRGSCHTTKWFRVTIRTNSQKPPYPSTPPLRHLWKCGWNKSQRESLVAIWSPGNVSPQGERIKILRAHRLGVTNWSLGGGALSIGSLVPRVSCVQIDKGQPRRIQPATGCIHKPPGY